MRSDLKIRFKPEIVTDETIAKRLASIPPGKLSSAIIQLTMAQAETLKMSRAIRTGQTVALDVIPVESAGMVPIEILKA